MHFVSIFPCQRNVMVACWKGTRRNLGIDILNQWLPLILLCRVVVDTLSRDLDILLLRHEDGNFSCWSPALSRRPIWKTCMKSLDMFRLAYPIDISFLAHDVARWWIELYSE